MTRFWTRDRGSKIPPPPPPPRSRGKRLFFAALHWFYIPSCFLLFVALECLAVYGLFRLFGAL